MSRNIIFIVGSKPDAIFPEVLPNKIITANSALKNVQQYYGKVDITAVISDQIFTKNDIPGEEGHLMAARNSIRGCKMDKIVLLKTLSDKSYIVDINSWLVFDNYNFLSRYDYHRLIRKFVWLSESLIQLFKTENTFSILKTIYQTIRYGKYNPTEISTGMIALAYALDNFKDSLIYVIGVGVDQNSGYDYSDKSKYNYFHIPRDIFFIECLNKRDKLDNIHFTDPTLCGLVADIKSR